MDDKRSWSSKVSKDLDFHSYVQKYKSIFKKCLRLAMLKYNSNYILRSKDKVEATGEVVRRETGHLKTRQLIKYLHTTF